MQQAISELINLKYFIKKVNLEIEWKGRID